MSEPVSEPVSACELAGDAVIFGVYSDVTLDAGALAAFGLIAAVVTNRQPLWFVSDYQLRAAAELNIMILLLYKYMACYCVICGPFRPTLYSMHFCLIKRHSKVQNGKLN